MISSNAKSALARIAAAPVALAVSAASIYVAVQLGTKVYKASLASPGWPSVLGEVRSTSIARGCGKHNGYFLQLTYVYGVGGKQYTGDRMSFTKRFCDGSYTAAQDMATKYEPGTPVDVYYDPGKPSDSVLKRGSLEEAWGFIFLPVFLIPVLLAAAVAFSVYGRPPRRVFIDTKTLRARQTALAEGIEAEIVERQREKARRGRQ